MRRATTNTMARYKLLKRLLEGNGRIPPSLVGACQSQNGLAKLHLASEGITPLALNTLKASANEAIETGGWPKLDEMREQLLQVAKNGRIKDRRRKEQGTASTPAGRIEDLSEALSTERHYRLRLEMAHHDLMGDLRKLAKSNPTLTRTLDRYVTGYSFKRLTVISGGRRE